MRCPDCSKFVGMENGDLEVDQVEVETNDDDYVVTVEASLPRNCAECSTELKRGSFSSEETIPYPSEDEARCKAETAPASDGKKLHDLTIEEDSNDITEKGGGRYAKNMIGYTLDYTVTCQNEGCGFTAKGQITDEMNAGSFEESI